MRLLYIGLMPRASTVWPAALAGSLLLGGCSLSVPGWGEDSGPATTGSIAAPVEVQKPLPKTLAYSDAAKIGQAAAATLWQAEGTGGAEWVNSATGSSGTVEASSAAAQEPCGDFNTVVTSIGGVHQYSGRVCRTHGGRSVVEIAPEQGRAS
jgi:hypothetical protein